MLTEEEFLVNYEYEKGVTFIDGWRYTTVGDCDDFALTVAYIKAGGLLALLWNILTCKSVFWLVKSPSNKLLPRHVILWHRGSGWIDSTVREWRDTPSPHKRVVPLIFPYAYLRILWGALGSLVYKWFRSV